MPNVLAYAELRGGDLRKIALETTSAARALADAFGGEVHVVLAGAPGSAAHAAALGEHGADVVYLSEHDAFAQYSPEALAALIVRTRERRLSRLCSSVRPRGEETLLHASLPDSARRS